MSLYKEFKNFITKGNVLDLAVAVIIAGAFGKIIASLVADIIMPLIGAIMGGSNIAGLSANIGDATISYGLFIQTTIDFVVIALSVFLFIKLIDRAKNKKAAAPAPAAPSKEEVLLSEIRDILKEKN